MRIQWKSAKLRPMIAALLCGFAFSVSWARDDHRPADTSSTLRQGGNENHRGKAERTLSEDDGLSVIAAALDSQTRRYSGRDCSHLVHAIYKRAGFPYAYASSSDIYKGIAGFERVKQPQTGDLVVWRGHVGIVVSPSRHIFFSYRRSGPGIDDYQT